jgi:hypothetical protein
MYSYHEDPMFEDDEGLREIDFTAFSHTNLETIMTNT